MITEQMVLEASADEFMKPDLEYGDGYIITPEYGDDIIIPPGYMPNDYAQDNEGAEQITGWFYRLSAPGYMDATEWGVAPSKQAALQALLSYYE